MKAKHPYGPSFYGEKGSADNLSSAQVIVPLIHSLVQPKSLVDVGCGSGVWLTIFQELGVKRILGIEGLHVDPTWLRLPKDSVRFMDLSKPFQLDETFDLALCLEVAEHLPPASAAHFVDSLVKLAPIILFSAAVPLQGGVHHLNEQWPGYWRALFLNHRFQMLDLVRKEIWLNPKVEIWYRQNTFLIVREDLVSARPSFREAEKYSNDLLLIHPEILERHQLGLRAMAKNLPKSVRRAAKHLAKKVRKHLC